MNYTISSAFIKTDEHPSHPNGQLSGRASVNYFSNVAPRDPRNPTKVANVSISNENGVAFFESRTQELSVSTIRSIANALSEIADKAQEAHDELIRLNKSVDKR
jgi:hypothetical protein